MVKSLLYLLVLTALLVSKERVEIFAKHIIVENNTTLIAKNGVIVLYRGDLIKANRAVYDRRDGVLSLKGDVEYLGKGENRLSSDRLTIDTISRDIDINHLFLAGEDNLWIDASSGKKDYDIYRLGHSKISSCNRIDPDWTIEFSRADYYKSREILTMEDAKVRFYDTTILYFPYLAFPTVHKRTTGLLYPRFKITKRDGLVYEQPLFYAPKPNWDIEFDPQLRVKRGVGAYLTARFVDSNHSNGYARVGYFKNRHSYARLNNLHNEHKGMELFYQSTDFLSKNISPKDYKSGLYLNSIYLNDREYLNLQKESASKLVKSNLIESRLNAFLYNSKNYFGIYGRYNIDISKKNNNRTIQELPSLEYHKYLQQIMKSRLFYSFDARVKNFTRTEGSRAIQLEANLPINYYDSFFNNYLDLSISENLYLNRVDFRNIDPRYKDYYIYYRNYHTITLSSDLIKKYNSYTHTIHPKITYIIPSREKELPLSYRYLADEKKELFVTDTKEEQFSFALEQYINSLDMNFIYSLGYSYYPNRIKSQGDFVNELEYKKDNISVYSNLKYAFDEGLIHTSTNSFRYNQNNYDIMLTHFYNNDFLFKNKKSSFLQAEFINHYKKENSWFVNFDYDMEQGYNHQWGIGWSHKQKCWSSKITIGQEIIPNIDSSLKNTALYLELNLYPIGGIQQNIEDNFLSQGANN